jgi:dCMP deaminase
MQRHDWHRRFIEMAGLISSWSKDPSTKVGAIIVRPDTWTVVATGYNGFPRGVQELRPANEGMIAAVEYNERWRRPEKYLWVEHAERNAIYNAARNGQATEGCVLYMNYAPCPCCDCARAVIQAGIVEVVGPDRFFDGKGDQWAESLVVSQAMLDEAGVITTTVERPVQ